MSVASFDRSETRPSEAEVLYRLTDRLYRAQTLDDVYASALDAIVGTLGCTRASILLFDDAGVMRFVAHRGLSEDYRTRLDGHTPWKPGERDPQPIFVSDIQNTDEPDWIKRAIKKEGIRALGFIPLIANGGTIGKFMTYYDAPRTFNADEIDLAVTIARQIGFSIERFRAEQALRESEERFRLMADHSPVMIWLSDQNGRCLHLNKQLREFWGVGENDLATFDWAGTIHPMDIGAIGQAMGEGMARRAAVDVKGRYRDAQGRYRILETHARPRISNGQFLGMIGVNIDVTEREEAEAARREAEAHRELLVAELNHRVKNTLSVVQALAHQTFKGVAELAVSAFSGRIRLLSRAHDLLMHSSWGEVPLRDLAASALTVEDQSRIVLDGPDVILKPRQAVALGMAMHELFTNALKYGALSSDQGKVVVTWRPVAEPQPMIELIWREEGGPPVTPPSRKGFGTTMLERSLRGDINGTVEIDYAPSGLICRIYFAP